MKEASVVKQEIFSKTKKEWEAFFQNKKDDIQEAISVYLELRKLYNNDERILMGWLFFAFYGMGGRLKQEKKKRFMEFFKKDIGDSADVVAIVNEINGDKTSSEYFSFVTKMLNLKNDNVYPIYDSRIAKRAFDCNKSELSLRGKAECYHRIKELYDSIAEQDDSIVVFKSVFQIPQPLGKMRILDFILYHSV